MTFENCAKTIQCGKEFFSTKGDEKTGYPPANARSWTLIIKKKTSK
jgi:hypothetical protein